ncbi:MAG: WG repeat-containing protein [Deltaproteobacteria bacterium]|nr:WG repeat-containing protein [Candidatus Zymogenaceae bacterium]
MKWTHILSVFLALFLVLSIIGCARNEQPAAGGGDESGGSVDGTSLDKVVAVIYAIEPQFEDAGPFSEGLAPIFSTEAGELWGYIDTTGTVVIEPKFDAEGLFGEGLAPVRVDRQWGYINAAGEMVIEPMYATAWTFADGLAPVGGGVMWGYIDTEGDVAISPTYTDAFRFSEGMAAVRMAEGITKKWVFINTDGSVAIDGDFTFIDSFSDGLAAVYVEDRWGYINQTGDFVIKPTFEDAYSFTEGLAQVYQDGGYVFIDNKANVVIKSEDVPFDNAGLFREGLSPIQVGELWGYMNTSGDVIIEPQFEEAYSFSDGLGLIKLEGRYGYIQNPLKSSGGD